MIKLTMLMPVQIIVHEGVALIFEIPQDGLNAKPAININAAIPANINQN